MGVAQLLLIGNFFYSIYRGKKCGRNPWNANGLEWAAPSPPPHGNFDVQPVCYRGPYEYSSPLSGDDDYLMQTEYRPFADRQKETAAHDEAEHSHHD